MLVHKLTPLGQSVIAKNLVVQPTTLNMKREFYNYYALLSATVALPLCSSTLHLAL